VCVCKCEVQKSTKRGPKINKTSVLTDTNTKHLNHAHTHTLSKKIEAATINSLELSSLFTLATGHISLFMPCIHMVEEGGVIITILNERRFDKKINNR